MKMLFLITIFSLSAVAGDFYYMKDNGWAGPYDSEADVPKNLIVECKAVVDPATGFPYDRDEIECDSATKKAKLKGADKLKVVKDAKAKRDARIKKGEMGRKSKWILPLLAPSDKTKLKAFYENSDIKVVFMMLDSGHVDEAKALLQTLNLVELGMSQEDVDLFFSKMGELK